MKANVGDVVEKKTLFNPKFAKFFKFMVGKQGVRVKDAHEVGKRSVEYFRGDNFVEFVKSHSDTIIKRYPAVVEGIDDLNSDEGASMLAERLMKERFFVRAAHEALPGQDSNRRPKWPKKLTTRGEPADEFSAVQFYIITFESRSPWNNLLLVGLICVVLMFVMFPIWPVTAKVWTWYASFTLLCLLIGVSVARLVAFVLLWFFGCEFWILPNMYDEYMGFFESFSPLYSFERRKDDWKMYVVRAVFFLIMVGGFYQLSQTHSIDDISEFAKGSFMELLEWGERKLTEDPVTQPQYLSIEHFEETADEDVKVGGVTNVDKDPSSEEDDGSALDSEEILKEEDNKNGKKDEL